MNRPELYRKTVDILIDAYFKGTLSYGCSACAVGNIIAANKGYKFKLVGGIIREFVWEGYINECGIKVLSGDLPAWGRVFSTIEGKQFLNTDERLDEQAKDEIECTGYSLPELMLIEYAYETAPRSSKRGCMVGEYVEDSVFNGLSAVIETLNRIHEVSEYEQTPILVDIK